MDAEQVRQRIIALNKQLEQAADLTDHYYLFDAETEEQALVNWVNPQSILIRQALIYRILRDCF